MRYLRKIDEHAPRDTDLSRETRALCANGILDHLDDDILAFMQQSFYRLSRILALPQPPDICQVKEGGAIKSDVDKS